MEPRLIVRNAASWIEYPTQHLALGDRDWPLPLLARTVAVGILGIMAVLGVP